MLEALILPLQEVWRHLMVLLTLRELELSLVDLILRCVLALLGMVQVSLLHANNVGVSFSEMVRVEVVRRGRVIVNQ